MINEHIIHAGICDMSGQQVHRIATDRTQVSHIFEHHSQKSLIYSEGKAKDARYYIHKTSKRNNSTCPALLLA